MLFRGYGIASDLCWFVCDVSSKTSAVKGELASRYLLFFLPSLHTSDVNDKQCAALNSLKAIKIVRLDDALYKRSHLSVSSTKILKNYRVIFSDYFHTLRTHITINEFALILNSPKETMK